MTRRIQVMVVDDSALARRALTSVLTACEDIEVIATAHDAFAAADRLRKQVPDVILLDIEMPRLDGLAFLRQLMKQHPIPTIICSAVAAEGSANAIAALEAGAVDVIEKPRIATQAAFAESAERLHAAVRAAAGAKLFAVRGRPSLAPRAVARTAPRSSIRPQSNSERIIVLGASTGGTEAIRVFLEGCDRQTPGVLIVQHMPAGFTAGLARRLDQLCEIRVKEAEHGDPVVVGQALIAPGNRHMVLRCNGRAHYVELHDEPPVNHHRPSVDVLFHSAAQACARHCSAVILTGMGDDGARGMLALHNGGCPTFAQDEASCVVYGMPREAVRLGGASQVVPLRTISQAAIGALRNGA